MKINKYLCITLLLCLFPLYALADIEVNENNFPDANFRNFLLSQRYVENNVIKDAYLTSITSMFIENKDISDLTGIEYFTGLTTLRCGNNKLTSLDLSKQTALISLECQNNQLTSLKLPKGTYISTILCFNNFLSELDISTCDLGYLDCSNNLLTTLNMSSSKEINNFKCICNKIKGEGMDALIANLPKRTTAAAIYFLDGTNENEKNECTTEQVAAAKAKGWTIFIKGEGKTESGFDNWIVYEGGTTVVGIEINETNFPDANFRKYLLEQSYGTDGIITYEEIDEITKISINNKGINDLKGIEFFTKLTTLSSIGNNLSSLDISKNTAIETLYISLNQTPLALDVTNNKELVYLNCAGDQLVSLDVSKNTKLKSLKCSDNRLTELNLSKNPNITTLHCENNQITSLDISGCNDLNTMLCFNNLLSVIDLSTNGKLNYLNCANNELTALSLTNNTELEYLLCDNNKLTGLDLSNNAIIQYLLCCNNNIEGSSMDMLISSLPIVEEGNFYVIDAANKNEGNICTTNNVADLKVKGWTAYYSVEKYESGDYIWIPYEGSPAANVVNRIYDQPKAKYYSLNGSCLPALRKGINILRVNNDIVKIIVK